MRSARAAGSSGSGSPNTIGPDAIVHTLAAALVTAMTGAALPTWRLRAETARPISDSVAIVNASGSKKMRDLLNTGDWDGLVALGKEQEREGAHILDVNVDVDGRDGEAHMID